MAFNDVERVASPSMFRPRQRRGRRPKDWAEAKVQSFAAIAIDLLMKKGDLPADDAAKAVVKVLRSYGVAMAQGQDQASDWKAVREWRRM